MFAGLITTVIGWGVPKKLATPLLIVFGIALLLIVLSVGKCAYDRSVIEKHDAKVEVSQAKADRKADNAAATQRGQDTARRVQEKQELEDARTESADPATRKREFYRCLRLQQAARANGKQPPTC